MARAAAKPSPKPQRPPKSPAKKPRGRPLGSKNKVASKTSAKPAITAKPKRVATRKADTAPKTSKADLELQVAKLEGALARARKQVAELKRMVLASGAATNQIETAEQTTSVAAKTKPRVAPNRGKKAALTRRGDQEKPVLEAGTGEAETEAHAS